MRRSSLAAWAAAAALGLVLPAAAQDRPVELKFGFWVPPAHPLIPSATAWGESIARASNGTIKVTVFPSEQLGKAFDHYDMARDGIADLAFVNPGYQPGRFPVIGAGELPFLIANAKGGSLALDEWYRKYAEREMRDVKVCLTHLHDPGTLHAKRKFATPDQIRGMKIRPAHATMGQFVTLLGGTNVQASAPEAREVLERGVADAITFPWNSILLFRIDTAVKFHMDVPMYATTFAWVMNRGKYNGMSAAQKKAMDDHCTNEWAGRIANPWADYEADGRGKIKAMADHTTYALTDAELAQWKTAAEPLRKQWADNVAKAGLSAEAVMGELQAALKKHNAAY